MYDYIRVTPVVLGFNAVSGFIAVELPNVPNRTEIPDDNLRQFGVNDEQRLFKHIIHNYDVSVRPVRNASTVVDVYMGLTLTHIFNIVIFFIFVTHF
ncbi:unnamed protein product [Gongylonema pulchrum]|uniref:Neur_chan_LBD domain-containing protein n=1 Tax=Gongylonema pulchrum TaxID=637853 RepID=A0A183D0B7_9BILA|nr:unnamed protein product [Gongylonema pulchrum]